MYKDEKIAHIATYLIRKLGGRVERLKLAKLMYLADRQSLDDRGCSMSGDQFVSIDWGPVPLSAYGFMWGRGAPSEQSTWDRLIENHKRDPYHTLRSDEADLDLLSLYDEEVLDRIVEKYGTKLGTELAYDCPEWEEPRGVSEQIEIKIRKILRNLEYDEKTALYYEAQAADRDALDRSICATP